MYKNSFNVKTRWEIFGDIEQGLTQGSENNLSFF